MIFNIFKKNNPKKWNRKGIEYSKEGKYEEAIRCYDKALELDPNFEEALKAKKELESVKMD